MKLTGIAPPVEATVNEVVAKVLPSPLPTVAAICTLSGVLLGVTPVSDSVVVVVIVIVCALFDVNTASPDPAVVEIVNVIVMVLVDGVTVAIMGALPGMGTTGVPENETVGVTVPGPEPSNSQVGFP